MQSTELKQDEHQLVETGKKSKKSQLTVSYHSLQGIEQKLVFVQLLRNEYPSETFSSVIAADNLEALEVINKDANKVSLISRIAPKTLLGDVVLARMIAKPLTATKEIYARQSVIKETLQDVILDKDLNEALKNVAAGQEKLFSFFDKKNELSKELESRVYFGDRLNWLNKNNAALYSLRSLQALGNFVLAVPLEFIGAFSATAMFEGLKAKNRWEIAARILGVAPFKATIRTAKVMGYSHNPFKTTADNTMESVKPVLSLRENAKIMEANYEKEIAQTAGDKYENMKNVFPDSKVKALSATILPVILIDLLNVYRWYIVAQKIQLERSLVLNMHERLIDVAKLVKGLHDINLLIKSRPNLKAAMPQLQYVENLFNNEKVGNLCRLVALLQTSTFKGSSSYFFSQVVRILIAYKLMGECKSEFVKALEAVGELDALHSVAQLFKQNKKGKYCFVELLDSEKPVIKFDRMWNPLIDADAVVTNDIQFGVDGDRNMLITGPNGSGKSTNMKAIALNILLGQTFGVAAAEKASLTPFDYIKTYLNVQENVKEQLSTFMAEIYRLEGICSHIKNLPANKRSFTVIDEGLRGTVAEEGVSRLYSMMREMISSDQSIVILATHFELPTQLEKETGRVSNYYVTIEEPTAGEFIRTYQLNRGINEWWFADKSKRQRFIDWLIKIGRK